MGALVQVYVIEGNQSISPDIRWVSFLNPRHKGTMFLEQHS